MLYSRTFDRNSCLCSGDGSYGHIIGDEEIFLITDETGPTILTSNPGGSKCINIVRIASANTEDIFSLLKTIFNPETGTAVGASSLILVSLTSLVDVMGAFGYILHMLDLCDRLLDHLSTTNGGHNFLTVIPTIIPWGKGHKIDSVKASTVFAILDCISGRGGNGWRESRKRLLTIHHSTGSVMKSLMADKGTFSPEPICIPRSNAVGTKNCWVGVVVGHTVQPRLYDGVQGDVRDAWAKWSTLLSNSLETLGNGARPSVDNIRRAARLGVAIENEPSKSVRKIVFCGDSNLRNIYNSTAESELPVASEYINTNEIRPFTQANIDWFLAKDNNIENIKEVSAVVISLGGNYLIRDRAGVVNFDKDSKHPINASDIASDDILNEVLENILYLVRKVSESCNDLDAVILLGILPRHFKVCCDSRLHMSIDYDGIETNKKIRDLNYFLGKKVYQTYGHDKVYFANPATVFSPNVWSGATKDGRPLLRPDGVHLTAEAVKIAMGSIMTFLEATENIEIMDLIDRDSRGLPDSFVKWRADVDFSQFPAVNMPPSNHDRNQGRGKKKPFKPVSRGRPFKRARY